jgi:hypothetical protein
MFHTSLQSWKNMVFIYHSFSWFPFHEKMWKSINNDFLRSTVFKPWFSMVYKPRKRRVSPNHDKMWLQNHEKTRNIETMKKWGLQTMVYHGNDQQKILAKWLRWYARTLHDKNSYFLEKITLIQALRRQWFAGVRPGVLGGNEPRAAPYDN